VIVVTTTVRRTGDFRIQAVNGIEIVGAAIDCGLRLLDSDILRMEKLVCI